MAERQSTKHIVFTSLIFAAVVLAVFVTIAAIQAAAGIDTKGTGELFVAVILLMGFVGILSLFVRAKEGWARLGGQEAVFLRYARQRDLGQSVVVRTLPRMTAPAVREGLIQEMAEYGFKMTTLTRTTTGKTVLTFEKQGV